MTPKYGDESEQVEKWRKAVEEGRMPLGGSFFTLFLPFESFAS